MDAYMKLKLLAFLIFPIFAHADTNAPAFRTTIFLRGVPDRPMATNTGPKVLVFPPSTNAVPKAATETGPTPVTVVPIPVVQPSNLVPTNQATIVEEHKYWMTISTNKRHNEKCRYYKNSIGRDCKSDEGIACRLCGG